MGGKNNRIQQNASVGLFQIPCRYIHKKPHTIKPEETNTGKKPKNPKNKKARREYNKMPKGNAAASIQLLTKKKKRQTTQPGAKREFLPDGSVFFSPRKTEVYAIGINMGTLIAHTHALFVCLVSILFLAAKLSQTLLTYSEILRQRGCHVWPLLLLLLTLPLLLVKIQTMSTCCCTWCANQQSFVHRTPITIPLKSSKWRAFSMQE